MGIYGRIVYGVIIDTTKSDVRIEKSDSIVVENVSDKDTKTMHCAYLECSKIDGGLISFAAYPEKPNTVKVYNHRNPETFLIPLQQFNEFKNQIPQDLPEKTYVGWFEIWSDTYSTGCSIQ